VAGLSYSTCACFKPIGVVVEGLERFGERGAVRSRFEIISVIRIFDEFAAGLEGLDEYSHLIIVYWMHEVREVRLKGRPWGIERYPEVGVFATRFPPRPNPIGVTVVELSSLEKPVVKVRGLDAWTGTPILDIKPYDYYDIVKNPRVPWWFRDKWEEEKLKHSYERIAPWLGPCT
jgi:tRNA-Thr(GGU) m(6)t(6)A37 methyltransferase TsaA